ncbi:C40 family peptidase [Actinotalea sp. M2MS4P-6]|uniref:C40 family peptidase n=1 Tax=Actinotalea sp. M2MS4P-6 TaxID=2983762 RepID=UPI0021E36470|nr:C40 family peptidase [Actinotalea sp. M2MS4P-6]MCV2394982.1 C40 family peptidase [Actinotalea sp. M2MS4P-6]
MRVRSAAIALALVIGAGTAGPAGADPIDDDDVAQAAAAVDAASADVARIELELAVQSSELDDAWTAVAVAGEAYTQATVDADTAQATFADATARADQANADAEQAGRELGAIALEAYRSGGGLDAIGALLVADGVEDLMARSAAMDQLGTRAQQAVQRLEAAQIVADTLNERAQTASQEATAAADHAAEALAQAEQTQQDTEQRVAAIQAERETLLVRLATARQTSVEVETARMAQQDAERRAREEAAARAARESSGTPTTSTPSTPSTGTPTTSPSTAPSAEPTTAPTSTPTTSPSAEPSPTPSATSTPTPTPTPAPTSDPYGLGTGSQRGSASQGESAVAWALSQVGKPYVYGAAGPDSFDCSGLTMRSWQAAGVSIYRTSRDQYRQVKKISYDSLRPGDLVFWGTDPSNPSSVYHVAMYIGGGQIVEAPRPGLTVRVVPMRWSGTMPYAGRP